MQKKNPTIGAILGFFILGLPYSGGLKKGLIGLVALCVISSAIAAFVSPHLSIIANAAGAYLGYKWTNEHNAAVDGEPQQPTENE